MNNDIENIANKFANECESVEIKDLNQSPNDIEFKKINTGHYELDYINFLSKGRITLIYSNDLRVDDRLHRFTRGIINSISCRDIPILTINSTNGDNENLNEVCDHWNTYQITCSQNTSIKDTLNGLKNHYDVIYIPNLWSFLGEDEKEIFYFLEDFAKKNSISILAVFSSYIKYDGIKCLKHEINPYWLKTVLKNTQFYNFYLNENQKLSFSITDEAHFVEIIGEECRNRKISFILTIKENEIYHYKI